MITAAGVKQLRLKFPGDESLLFRDLSFAVGEGEKVLLLGPSGCGKSTLLQVLTGIIPGSVEVPMKHEDITIPASWGYVFQDPDTQFCMPFVDEELAFVLENLQVPRREMPERIRHYLELAGLRLDDIHTPINALSQGMKQRLAIASVLALEPNVLFLDEPTALLDPEGTEQVWQTIKNVARSKTVLIVEHKIDRIVDFVDRVVLFDDQGRIIGDGDKNDVFARYKQQLIEYGIWYPGVWDDYSADRALPEAESRMAESGAPLLSLNDFAGYRGKNRKLFIPQADVYPGEWITVVGHNGAGKSTLLLSLMQLIRTTGGYKVQGQDAARINDLASQLAYVFQNPEFQFVTNSVYDEVAYTLRLDRVSETEIAEKTKRLLELFELSGKSGQHPYLLSMGQKRRLSVACAIVKEQPILLLDEPTFGQDARNTFAMLEKLEAWRLQGTAIVMVTHDMEIVERYATRIWTIADGKLASDINAERKRMDEKAAADGAAAGAVGAGGS
ncbi:ABC transporter ATP-binding protein [Paenibacillus contaminans]|uniref:ABC transporter ATP-binding protein n=1 Tax=Paenibacillus contaminans TaxID=450362 RepID=A0A329MQT0_9BACL|nr:ABC transporter ATP-binding protein [Paenibacillus contaminans]RAV22134.1 ABC transporter ATP-binding protein [Paenibacillus contaminans]